MVLEQLRFHRNTHLAQLELPGDYLGQALTDIRQGILVLTKLSQERPNLTIGINTDPPKGSPYMRPWPTIHDFFHDIGWSYDNEGKSLAFSDEQDWLLFTVIQDVGQRKEHLVILVHKNNSLIELQFKIKPTDGEELSSQEKKLERGKQKILSKSLEGSCDFSGNQAVFVHSLKAVIQDSHQLAFAA